MPGLGFSGGSSSYHLGMALHPSGTILDCIPQHALAYRCLCCVWIWGLPEGNLVPGILASPPTLGRNYNSHGSTGLGPPVVRMQHTCALQQPSSGRYLGLQFLILNLLLSSLSTLHGTSRNTLPPNKVMHSHSHFLLTPWEYSSAPGNQLPW